jgi:hypothetical protein
MSLADIADKIMTDRKTQVMAQTWGHLFPDDGAAIKGNIIMAYTVYRDIVAVQDNMSVCGSPWWYHALNEFMHEFLDKYNLDPGTVCRINTEARVIVHDDGLRSIKINATDFEVLVIGHD